MCFIRRTEASQGQLNTASSENNPKKRCRVLPISQPGPSKMPKMATSYFITKSLSVVEMLKLRKTIEKTSISIHLENFDMEKRFGHIPDLQKQSTINPLPKVSPPQEIQSDLRPISLTCTLANVMEGFARSRLMAQIGKTRFTPIRKGGALHHGRLDLYLTGDSRSN